MLLHRSCQRLVQAAASAVKHVPGVARPITSALLVIFVLGAGVSASATINSIASDWCHSCLPGAVHRIVAGKQTSMVVKGQFVDLSTRVEISGSGVTVSFGDRVGGSNSSIVVRFNVGASAALGERTVKLRYAIETSGPDTFQVKVVRGGRVDKIERLFTGRLIPANTIPVNQRVTLVFTGTRLGNTRLAANLAANNPHTLAGSTETRCEIELEFTRTGTLDVHLVDADVGPQPGNLLFKFFYDGAKQVTVAGAANPTTGGGVIPRIPTGGSATPTTFVDLAPRANVINLFRRTGNSITVGGQTFLQVEDRWCSENAVAIPAAGRNNSKVITVQDLIWGVSNVGTAQVAVAFDSELSTNNHVLQSGHVDAGTLGLGATRDFTFHRARSRVRVIRFGAPNSPGCFVNPTDPDFFEDPPFTVKVDVRNVVPEAATNRFNNARNY
jgi:hypothetical protein